MSFFTNIYVVVLCLFFAFMLSCYVYVLHLCCHVMFMFCIYIVMPCLFFAFMLLCYVYYFAFMLLCYVYVFAFMLCYIYFLNWCCYAMFFCFIVACNPMPACPPNYQRIGIPAAAAGAVLQSCYRVITAPALVNFRRASVSIYTCCRLCWRISKYMYLL